MRGPDLERDSPTPPSRRRWATSSVANGPPDRARRGSCREGRAGADGLLRPGPPPPSSSAASAPRWPPGRHGRRRRQPARRAWPAGPPRRGPVCPRRCGRRHGQLPRDRLGAARPRRVRCRLEDLGVHRAVVFVSPPFERAVPHGCTTSLQRDDPWPGCQLWYVGRPEAKGDFGFAGAGRTCLRCPPATHWAAEPTRDAARPVAPIAGSVPVVAETSHAWFPSNASNREWAVLSSAGAAAGRPPCAATCCSSPRSSPLAASRSPTPPCVSSPAGSPPTPTSTSSAGIERRHVEDYKVWLAAQPGRRASSLGQEHPAAPAADDPHLPRAAHRVGLARRARTEPDPARRHPTPHRADPEVPHRPTSRRVHGRRPRPSRSRATGSSPRSSPAPACAPPSSASSPPTPSPASATTATGSASRSASSATTA